MSRHRAEDWIPTVPDALSAITVGELWEGLDKIQRAAVSEVVHGFSPRLDHARFLAKYGRSPDWGSLDR